MSQRLEELRRAAELEFAEKRAAELAAQQQDPEPVTPSDPPAPDPVVVEDQPQDPPAPETPPAPPTPDPEPAPRQKRTVYKKVVDLGDGTPPQVFKAATKDELIEKILDAQKNATKRIKELKTELKKNLQNVQPDPAQPVKEYKPRTLNEDEELELANELQSNPTKAVEKAIEAIFGDSIEAVRSDLAYGRNARQRDTVHEVGRQFLAAHPEYPSTPKNEALMAEYIGKNNLAWTLKNLELAFAELQEAGLVTSLNATPNNELPSADELEEEEIVEVPATVVPVTPAAPVAPVVPATPAPRLVEEPRRRRAVVGVSSSQSVATEKPGTQHEVSVEGLLRMSPAERKRIVLASLGGQD